MTSAYVDVGSAADPVRAVLEARRTGARLALRTSGTSGTSGGAGRLVVRTTESWWASFPAWAALAGLTTRSVLWVPGPLTATMNLFAAVHAADAGVPVLTDAGPPATATHAALTPAQLERWRDHLPTGLHAIVAGDVLPPAAAAGLRTSHYYGAAELSFVAWGSHAADLEPFPGVEVVARGGELWSRSPFQADGYARPDDRGALRRDDQDWATVGDRGSVVDGRVAVDGRGDLAVTTAGATVLVADVEGVLRPVASGRVAVVGVPHATLGQVLTAVLSEAGDLAVLRTGAAAWLTPAARPRRWVHLPLPWPTTERHKLDRPTLAALAGELPHL